MIETFVHEMAYQVFGKGVDHPGVPESDRRFWSSSFGVRYSILWKELFGIEHYMKDFSHGRPYTFTPCTPGGTFGSRSLDLSGFDSLETERNFGGIFP